MESRCGGHLVGEYLDVIWQGKNILGGNNSIEVAKGAPMGWIGKPKSLIKHRSI